MEVGKSKYCPDGEPGVMYFKKPGEGEEWQKLSDIAARVSRVMSLLAASNTCMVLFSECVIRVHVCVSMGVCECVCVCVCV